MSEPDRGRDRAFFAPSRGGAPDVEIDPRELCAARIAAIARSLTDVHAWLESGEEIDPEALALVIDRVDRTRLAWEGLTGAAGGSGANG